MNKVKYLNDSYRPNDKYKIVIMSNSKNINSFADNMAKTITA